MLGVLPQFYKFTVQTEHKFGRALIANLPIIETEIICKMAGPLITLKEFFDKYEWNYCNPLQVGADLYIDLIEPYVLINHSCDPNTGVRNNGILFALRDIPAGEELTFDYSTSVDDVTWTMECQCQSPKCRKIIGDFQSIPHAQKEFYFNKNALTAYIKSLYY